MQKRSSEIRTSGRALVRRDNSGSKLRLLTIAGVAHLSILYAGMILGWTSPTLPRLEKPTDDNPLDSPLTPTESAWIGSIVALGAAVGPFPGGSMADRFGRKGAILLSTLPTFVGWLLIGLATSVEYIYAARFLFGLSIGSAFTVVPMYTGEIAEDSVRGAVGSFLQLFIVTGFLLAYAIGPYVSYIGLVSISLVPGVLFFIIFCFMPETPYYYLGKSKRDKALNSLCFLRGKSKEDCQSELDKIEVAVTEARAEATAFAATNKLSELFRSPVHRKCLALSFGLVTAQQFAGINVVLFYTESLFAQTGISMLPEHAAILLGSLQVLSSFTAPLFVDKLGRKVMLLISGVGLIVSLTSLGIYFKLDSIKYDQIDSLGWLPITSLLLYIVVFCMGFGPLPWAVMGELFSPQIKATASSMTASFCWFLTFLVTKYFETLCQAIGTHVVFWLFAACCLLACIFVHFCLPETKGLSLRQIQLQLNGGSSEESSVNVYAEEQA
ncbi:facilitated trehalose transporter Tret1-like [Ctenocephalides felis]|uniref:facilitated trehalose transporter Tret1-like n=1 Tax=Ctenocephalides felis TaxID=7515 RepID=UPI000E6E12DB|nr:facilitated trehalose transporter Tret1-like [Ctenocephalides felis]